MVMGEGRVCVVTGARGFAARHIVLMLLQSGSWIVKVSDLHPSIKLDPTEESGALGDALRSGRAVYVSADLRDKAQVINGNPSLFLAVKRLVLFTMSSTPNSVLISSVVIVPASDSFSKQNGCP